MKRKKINNIIYSIISKMDDEVLIFPIELEDVTTREVETVLETSEIEMDMGDDIELIEKYLATSISPPRSSNHLYMLKN